ncbi:MAG: DnaB-like helicase N-terminal domain-containing protein, partial [Gammaproteobacteria bacterium]|nr:DnaB-like helicase N-terminal domain-containing protein [Gammaproteobacteria bacterium]
MVSAIPDQEQFVTETDRLNLPPNSVQAEQALLGGLMLDKSAWDRIADRVVESDFYRPDHQLIFSAIRTLSERNEPCDAVTLSEYFDSHKQLDKVGGLGYL